MSQTKAQLVGGVGISTVSDLSVYGGVNATGVVTASSFVGGLTGDATGLTGTPDITVGFITATSFIGPLTGTASTATASGTAYGLSGTPNITVGFITATGASISGNVSTAGTLTYEDVTNVDSIGIITARSGVDVTGGSVVVGSAVTVSSGGITVGVVTATSVSVAASVTALEYYGDGSKLQNVGGELDITSSLFI